MIILGLQTVRRPLQSTNPWFGHRVVMNGRCQVRRNLIWKLGESRLMGTQSIFLCNILIFYLKNDVYTKTTSSVFFILIENIALGWLVMVTMIAIVLLTQCLWRYFYYDDRVGRGVRRECQRDVDDKSRQMCNKHFKLVTPDFYKFVSVLVF